MRLYEPDDKLSDDRLGEPSKAIRQRVEAAREIQQARFQGKGLTCNPHMGGAEVWGPLCRVLTDLQHSLAQPSGSCRRVVRRPPGSDRHDRRCAGTVPPPPIPSL